MHLVNTSAGQVHQKYLSKKVQQKYQDHVVFPWARNFTIIVSTHIHNKTTIGGTLSCLQKTTALALAG